MASLPFDEESARERILRILKELDKEEFAAFKWNLREPGNFPLKNPPGKSEVAEEKGRDVIADLLLERYIIPNNLEPLKTIMNNVLQKIHRNDQLIP